jgi:peptide/nickel transport system substrate-binding protein
MIYLLFHIRKTLITVFFAILWSIVLAGIPQLQAQAPSLTTVAKDAESLLTKAPFDRVILKDDTDLLIEPVAPRPLPPGQKKPGQRPIRGKRSAEAEARAREMENNPAVRLLIQPLEADGTEYALYREDIAEITYFEDMLLAEANRLIEAKDFPKAFEYLLYVQTRDPKWKGLAAGHRKLLVTEARDRFDAGEHNSGLQFVNEVLAIDSKDKEARSLAIEGLAKLAQADLSNKRYERARESHSRIKSLDPTSQAVKELETGLKSAAGQFLADAPKERPDRLDFLNAAWRAWPDLPGLSEARNEAMAKWPTLRVAVTEPVDQPPQPWQAGPSSQRIMGLVFKPLLKDLQESSFKGQNNEQILEKFEMLDLTTAELTIKTGLNWTSGRTINSRDVVAAMSSWALPTSPAFQGVWASLVQSVTAIGDRTIQVKFTRPIFQPESWFLRRIAPAETSQAEEVAASGWVGSGRYFWQKPSVESSGVQNVFQRRSEIIDGLFRIQEQVIPDETEGWQSLIDGRVDVVDHIPVELHANKPEDDQIQIAEYTSPEIHLLALDGRLPVIRNRSFRRALGYALNRPEILEEQFLKRPPKADELIADGVFAEGSSWDDNRVKPQPFDRALATLLFASAKRELKLPQIRLTLDYPARADVARVAARIADDLKLYGIEITLKSNSIDQLETRLTSGNQFEIAYRVIQPSLDHFLIGSGISPALYARPSMNGLASLASPLTRSNILDIERAWDETRVRQSAQFIDRLCRDELPVIPLWQIPRRYAWRSNVKGIKSGQKSLYENIESWSIESGPKP